jgi:outer membrane protein OmpA-like peptidoglycan-associated protein
MQSPTRTISLPLLLIGASSMFSLGACGGVIKFEDSTAFAVRSPSAPVVAEAPKRVEVKADRIVINEKIQFEIDKANILSASHGLLNEVVQVLQQNGHIGKVDILGHTDNDGPDNYNKDLSDRRAKAVMSYLVEHGVAADRLQAKGLGETQPIADNATSAGREQNRRVEFMIVAQAGGAT